MTEQIVCVVFGHPQGKGSKRAFPINRAGGSQSIVLVDSNRNAKPWQTRVTETLRAKYDGPLLRDAVAVELDFCFARPRSHYGTGRNAGRVRDSAPLEMTKMPDVDKLCRLALDSLVGVVIADDAQVVRLTARKRYSEPERLEARVSEI
jgi:Holliday junction resolvase RusA-like endonuclease